MASYHVIISFVFMLSALRVRCESRPNIVIFLTDDQDLLLRSMEALVNVQKLIGDRGATFTNAFVNSPICCPSRSTLLTGKYPHNTGVRNNSLSGNCSSRIWQEHEEPLAIANVLKGLGRYDTFYAGKYLNQYGDKSCGGVEHVPTGYDWWLGLKGNSRYYNYTLSVNGTGRFFADEYLTDVMKQYALDFLDRRSSSPPFFMTLATPAAHAPFTPAPRHARKFGRAKAPRTASFNVTAVNKHWLMSMPPASLPGDVAVLDDIHRRRLQTLLAVDEMVEAVVGKLEEIGVINETFIWFLSDNGYHIGQFSQAWDKRQPYETDIRIPLLVRGPGIAPKQLAPLPVSFVDIAPTIFEMARIALPVPPDGRSFYRDITSPSPASPCERNALIEYWGEGGGTGVDPQCPWSGNQELKECSVSGWCKCEDSRNNTYRCVRRISAGVDYKFCKFADSLEFVEAYDLLKDPFELSNIYEELSSEVIGRYSELLDRLSDCRGKNCLLTL